MPRYVLHRSKSATAGTDEVPAGLRADGRVKVIDELPRLVLIDCPADVASEWADQMPGWKLQWEGKADVPDPRPKPG